MSTSVGLRYDNSSEYGSATTPRLAPIYTPNDMLDLQLIVKNLFDKDFYGISRESGSGDVDSYDAVNNVNPPGFIAAYHPQPGRTFMLRANFKF